MKKITLHIIFCIAIILPATTFSQLSININQSSDKNLNVEDLTAQKEKVKEREKDQLKNEIDEINQELKDGKITEEVADQKKRDAAKKHAENIQNQLDIIDANIELLNRNKGKNSKYYKNMGYLDPDQTIASKIINGEFNKPHRTKLGATISFGINNAIGPKQSLDDTPYKIGNSNFFNFGLELRTAITKKGFLRVNYGIEFQFNNLHPGDNLYFVKNDNETSLANFEHDLKKSKFALNNIVVPIHIEIGKTDENLNPNRFRLGVGGYAGLNMSAIQTLKYKVDGHRVKDRIKNNYNTNNIIYGLSAYFGWRWISIYAKYDLNTIFTHNALEEHCASIGLRLLF